MTVQPDQGLQLLSAQLQQGRHAAPQPAGTEAAADLSIGAVIGRLTTAVQANTSAIERSWSLTQTRWKSLHPIDLAPAQTTTAGQVTNPPDGWGPQDGLAWRVFSWTVALGAGTTSASVYRDAVVPNNLLFQFNGSGLWEPTHTYLLPGQQLVWNSVGGGITLSGGRGLEIALDELPRYLGLKT